MNEARRKFILLVEDEAIIALAEEMALSRLGYRVETAISGEAAVDAAKSRPDFDLVLMDVDLGPGIDGTEAAELILKSRDIPIVFLSSHTEPEIVEKTEKITSYGYVVKDSNPAVLDASLKMAFKLFQANRETRKANEKLRAIVDAFPDLMLIVDKDGYFRGYEKGPNFSSLAIPEKSILGAHLTDVFPPEEAAFHLGLYRTCIATGKVQEHTYSMTMDGEEKVFDLRLSRLDDSSILAVIRDISEGRKSEEELRKLSHAIENSMKLLNEMGSIAKIGAWKTDIKTQHIQWTDELYSIYDVDTSFIPTLEHVMEFYLPESRRAVEAASRRLTESGEPFDIEVEMITPKGSRRWIRMIGRAGYTDGVITHRVGVTQDITERKHSEELLRINEKQVRALLEEKDLLLKEVHHRVKNNMASMMSLLALQAEGIRDPAAAAALKDAQHRFRSMGVLYDRLYRTDNLREMSIGAYLPTLMREIAAMSHNGSGIRIEDRIENFPLGVRELSIVGLIVNELLTNALKHAFPRGGEGRIIVSASKREDVVMLSVEDDGVGMPEKTDSGAPAGFGLMLVRTLAAQVKGSLRIEGGSGTRIVLEFVSSPAGE